MRPVFVAAVDAATAGVLVAVIAFGTPVLTYLGLRYKSSGRVNSTEAETLWAEATKMRQMYRDEVDALRIDAMNMREDVVGLRREILRLGQEAEGLRVEVDKWRRAAEGTKGKGRPDET